MLEEAGRPSSLPHPEAYMKVTDLVWFHPLACTAS